MNTRRLRNSHVFDILYEQCKQCARVEDLGLDTLEGLEIAPSYEIDAVKALQKRVPATKWIESECASSAGHNVSFGGGHEIQSHKCTLLFQGI